MALNPNAPAFQFNPNETSRAPSLPRTPALRVDVAPVAQPSIPPGAAEPTGDETTAEPTGYETTQGELDFDMIFGEHAPEDTGAPPTFHCAEWHRPHTITAPAAAQPWRRPSSEASDLHDPHSPFSRRDFGNKEPLSPLDAYRASRSRANSGADAGSDTGTHQRSRASSNASHTSEASQLHSPLRQRSLLTDMSGLKASSPSAARRTPPHTARQLPARSPFTVQATHRRSLQEDGRSERLHMMPGIAIAAADMIEDSICRLSHSQSNRGRRGTDAGAASFADSASLPPASTRKDLPNGDTAERSAPHSRLPHDGTAGTNASSRASSAIDAATPAHDFTNVVRPPRDCGICAGHFRIVRLIGKGGFGQVFLVTERGSGHPLTNSGGEAKKLYAMKVVSKERLIEKDSVEYMLGERNILTNLHHPFLLRLLAAFHDEKRAYLLTPYLPGGELFHHLGEEGLFPEATAAFYAAEVVLALEHLHSRGVVHRDLKPENVLLGEDGHIVLCDFGLAKQCSNASPRESSRAGANVEVSANKGIYRPPGVRQRDEVSLGNADDENDDSAGGKHTDRRSQRHDTVCGTTYYMAPEMLARTSTGYGKSVDWWALGCLLFEMMTGQPPFKHRNPKKLHHLIMKTKPRLPPWLGAEAHSVLKGFLERNVEKRLGCGKSSMFQIRGIGAIKRHRFFALHGIDGKWEALVMKDVEPPLRPVLEGPDDTSNFDKYLTDASCILSRISSQSKSRKMQQMQSKHEQHQQLAQGGAAAPVPVPVAGSKQVVDSSGVEDGVCTSDTASRSFGGFSYVAADMLHLVE